MMLLKHRKEHRFLNFHTIDPNYSLPVDAYAVVAGPGVVACSPKEKEETTDKGGRSKDVIELDEDDDVEPYVVPCGPHR
ncbi:hypothetical protein ZHAS_00016257 [Anopheles sinensis]|uniref:Uncharacterized protein n=1 Tax=Anopheles sinensis TaxID=74873 RepID=A0A084WD94_ANOSI|nr:hypothetical protein ZHAS_00016257 [Anopheles sinensis]